MAEASDYDFVDFTAAAPKDLDHYLCNTGSFDKRFVVGKDYAWCLEGVLERRYITASQVEIDSGLFDKWPYSPALSASNWNDIVADVDVVIASRRFLRSRNFLVDGTQQVDPALSPFLNVLDYYTTTTLYPDGRPEFAAGEPLRWQKIAALEDSIWALNEYVTPAENISADISQYNITQIAGTLPDTRKSLLWLPNTIYLHEARVSPLGVTGIILYDVGYQYEGKWIMKNHQTFAGPTLRRFDDAETWGIFRVQKKCVNNWFAQTLESTTVTKYFLLQIEDGNINLHLASPSTLVDRLLSLAGIEDDISHPLKTEADVNAMAWQNKSSGLAPEDIKSAHSDYVRIDLVSVFVVSTVQNHMERLL